MEWNFVCFCFIVYHLQKVLAKNLTGSAKNVSLWLIFDYYVKRFFIRRLLHGVNFLPQADLPAVTVMTTDITDQHMEENTDTSQLSARLERERWEIKFCFKILFQQFRYLNQKILEGLLFKSFNRNFRSGNALIVRLHLNVSFIR